MQIGEGATHPRKTHPRAKLIHEQLIHRNTHPQDFVTQQSARYSTKFPLFNKASPGLINSPHSPSAALAIHLSVLALALFISDVLCFWLFELTCLVAASKPSAVDFAGCGGGVLVAVVSGEPVVFSGLTGLLFAVL